MKHVRATVSYTAVSQSDLGFRENMSYVRVSILGRLQNEEVWSVNPVFDPSGEFGTTVDQTALDAASLAIATRAFPTTLRNALSLQGYKTGARVEVRADADDSLIAISVNQLAVAVSGLTAQTMPAQSAQVVSIRTNTPGASGRGRIYWPKLGGSLDTSGRIPAADVTAFIADMKTYLLGIRSDLATAFTGIGFDLAVRSRQTATTPHATRIQVGNVVDTQRRRRDALPEAYTTATFP